MTTEVKIRLLQRKLTLDLIAAKLGKQKAQVWHVLNGHRRGHLLRPQIAALLKKPESWLAKEIDKAKSTRRAARADQRP